MVNVEQNLDCLGLVLSGGLSTRMGRDKAMLSHTEQNMLSFSQQLLQQAGVSQTVISGKQHGVADKLENLGPMGGIYTIIEKFRPKALLVLPVDLPLMDIDCLKQLKRVGELTQQACFYQDNYLPLYLPISAFVEQFLQQSFAPLLQQNNAQTNTKNQRGPSIRSLLKHMPTKQITAKNQGCLFNTNTPEQWQQAKKQFSKNYRNLHV